MALGAGKVASVRQDAARPAAVGLVVGGLVGLAMAVGRPGVAAVLGAIAAFVLAFAVLFSVDRIARLEQAVSRLSADAAALWSLSPLGTTGGVLLPPLGGYALSPRAAAALLAHVLGARARTIVELGPGSSTALLVRLSQTVSAPPAITCLEHDRRFVGEVGNSLRYHGGGTSVRLIEAELEELSVADWTGRWYAAAAVEQLPSPIDVLVVDGPPEGVCPNARYPAYPVLRSRLSDGAVVFVDDTDRPTERAMVQRWIALGGLAVVQDADSFMVLRRFGD